MKKNNSVSVSRRDFISTTALAAAGLAFAPRTFATTKGKPNSKFGGV
ncbi:MAG: twin-arginine translocation signal domain-containing protein, partial [Bacteroidetes bacterium]